MNTTKSQSLTDFIHFTKHLNEKGGPYPEEYHLLDKYLEVIAREVKELKISKEDLEIIWSIFDEEFMKETLQGHSLKKPFGYAGDFKIIDMIYTASTNTKYKYWDNYYNRANAAQAVRNRKTYFKNLVKDRYDRNYRKVLNVASGPCRDVKELFEENELEELKIHCIEYDKNAIEYSRTLCESYLDKISFDRGNIFKFDTNQKFDLIWSAGLFDYFDDENFVKILKKLIGWANNNSEIVIGNFTPKNPSRNFMEVFLDWHLFHRDEKELMNLALEAGCNKSALSIEIEQAETNLFLHIKID